MTQPVAVPSRPLALLTAALWVVVVAAALYARPIMPIDETRYITVAWEMHLADHWLVPLLNGEPYHHKPPLLFWIIRLGWLLFGVSETWARLVAPLFGLGALGLTALLARLLWPGPEGRAAGAVTPLVLLTGAWWMLFATLTMFDLIMAFFAVLGWIGLTLALRHGRAFAGFALVALAIGLGILGKGPVILVYVLPPALFAPLWAGERALRPGWLGWYLSILGSVIAGAVMGLAWALPAAKAGGPAFEQALLWGQTAGRMKDSFAHRRPFWWYLPLLPLLLFPWSIWRPTWAALALWRQPSRDDGVRFGLTVCLAGLVIFSAISGKQPHYLLPLAPALALIVARALTTGTVRVRPADSVVPIAALVLLGAAFAAAPLIVTLVPGLSGKADFPDWIFDGNMAVSAILLTAALLAAYVARGPGLGHALGSTVSVAIAMFLAVHLAAFPAARPAYDLEPAARMIKRGQDEGRPVAYAGDYHGEYQFLGRLVRPLPEIEYRDIPAWFAANPDGWMVARYRRERLDTGPKPVYAQPKRGRVMVIWDRAALAEKPDFFKPD